MQKESKTKQEATEGDPVDFEMGRLMLASEWAANNDPRNNPKITWYYTSKKGLFGATARLSDKPEAKMLAFRQVRNEMLSTSPIRPILN